MLARDLIATVIKTFLEALEDVRDGGKQAEEESPYTDFYNSYFHKERDWFIKAGVSEITDFFAEDPVYKLEMFAELMFRDARQLTNVEIRAALFRKLIELYEVIDVRSMEFSLQRMNRVNELKSLLE